MMKEMYFRTRICFTKKKKNKDLDGSERFSTSHDTYICVLTLLIVIEYPVNRFSESYIMCFNVLSLASYL